MEHRIIALSFQHKRFSRLDVLTVLGDRAGESQRLLLPRVEEFSDKVSPPPPGGKVPADRFCFVKGFNFSSDIYFISGYHIRPSSQKQMSTGLCDLLEHLPTLLAPTHTFARLTNSPSKNAASPGLRYVASSVGP